jgi:hypothetical protein
MYSAIRIRQRGKVFTNVPNRMTGNFDDMSVGVQKLRKLNLPTLAQKIPYMKQE